MTDILSLEQLVHLSLGDPEAGAVNFNVLKTLLLQMLKAMNLFNYKPTMSDHDQRTIKEALQHHHQQHVSCEFEQDESLVNLMKMINNEIKQKSQRKNVIEVLDRLNTLEEKVFRFESQLNAFNEIPSNSELIDRAKQIPKKTSEMMTSNKNNKSSWTYT